MTSDLGPANSSPSAAHDSLRGIMTDAIRYWEARRIPYNLLLTGIVVVWIAWTWPHFRPAATLNSLLAMLVLAVLANLCYCSAYVADLAMQYSHYRNSWVRWRWGLWTFGMLFAALLANYWIADEIFPYVR